MTVRKVKIKGENLSFLAHADSSEQLVTGDLTGATPIGWNWKIKGTYFHWVDNNGDERRKEGTLTGAGRTSGSVTVHGDELYYGDYNGNERLLLAACFTRTELILTVIVTLSGGGGKIERIETMLTDTIALSGGGGKIERIETMLTNTVVLSLGSYP